MLGNPLGDRALLRLLDVLSDILRVAEFRRPPDRRGVQPRGFWRICRATRQWVTSASIVWLTGRGAPGEGRIVVLDRAALTDGRATARAAAGASK